MWGAHSWLSGVGLGCCSDAQPCRALRDGGLKRRRKDTFKEEQQKLYSKMIVGNHGDRSVLSPPPPGPAPRKDSSVRAAQRPGTSCLVSLSAKFIGGMPLKVPPHRAWSGLSAGRSPRPCRGLGHRLSEARVCWDLSGQRYPRSARPGLGARPGGERLCLQGRGVLFSPRGAGAAEAVPPAGSCHTRLPPDWGCILPPWVVVREGRKPSVVVQGWEGVGEGEPEPRRVWGSVPVSQ